MHFSAGDVSSKHSDNVCRAVTIVVRHYRIHPAEDTEQRSQLHEEACFFPHFAKRGIGRRLIEEGHRLLREKGEKLVFVVGDPAYYTRFGFSLAEAAKFRTPYDGPYLMSLKLAPGAPASGTVVYPATFAKLG